MPKTDRKTRKGGSKIPARLFRINLDDLHKWQALAAKLDPEMKGVNYSVALERAVAIAIKAADGTMQKAFTESYFQALGGSIAAVVAECVGASLEQAGLDCDVVADDDGNVTVHYCDDETAGYCINVAQSSALAELTAKQVH